MPSLPPQWLEKLLTLEPRQVEGAQVNVHLQEPVKILGVEGWG